MEDIQGGGKKVRKCQSLGIFRMHGGQDVYVQNAQWAVHVSLSHQPSESSLGQGLYAPVTAQRVSYLVGAEAG